MSAYRGRRSAPSRGFTQVADADGWHSTGCRGFAGPVPPPLWI